jgi:hypothetical protein
MMTHPQNRPAPAPGYPASPLAASASGYPASPLAAPAFPPSSLPALNPSKRAPLAAIFAALTLSLGACASNPEVASVDQPADQTTDQSTDQSAEVTPAPALVLPSAQYSAAFDAAKHALRDTGFLLERVDAQAGVITTQPKGTAGIATPWDREQSGLGQELDDFFHRQQRVARVEFVPVGSSLASNEDLRVFTGQIEARVQVAILRTYRPGRRVNTSNITSSTYTVDPQLQAQGLSDYSVAQKQDARLAQRVLDTISAKVQTLTDASPAQP